MYNLIDVYTPGQHHFNQGRFTTTVECSRHLEVTNSFQAKSQIPFPTTQILWQVPIFLTDAKSSTAYFIVG